MTPFTMVEKRLHEWYQIRQAECERLREYKANTELRDGDYAKVVNRIRVITSQLSRAESVLSLRDIYLDNEPDILTVGTFKTT